MTNVLRDAGFGRLITPAEWRTPIPDIPFAIDNGAWRAHVRGEAAPFEKMWDLLCGTHEASGRYEEFSKYDVKCYGVRYADWVVCPDLIGSGKDSLTVSRYWIERAPSHVRWLLAVQEGMTRRMVEDLLDYAAEEATPYYGIFVGGSGLDWKWRTTEQDWAPLCEERGLYLHVARVHTVDRLAWARLHVKADSVDSSAFAKGRHYHRKAQAERVTAWPIPSDERETTQNQGNVTIERSRPNP
jgi:hypothetical protein